MKKVIEVQNIGKQYRLGVVGSSTISDDLKRFSARIRGKEDPFLKLGELNDRTVKSDSKYVWALRDISFDVNEGEVLGIVGKNGAGKSTLLKLLSRITTPSTGSFRMKGRAGSLLEVGTGFHPELTGRENIFLNGAILGMTKPEISKKLDEIVAFSGIEKYIDTPVKRYSSGMMVRLGFAVAAHLEPEILIVDEVLAVGDVEFQKRCIGKMKEVSTHGRTILFVSHNMGAVRSLCSKGILLENGELTYRGTADEVVDQYLLSASNDSQTIKEWAESDSPGNSFARVSKIEINKGAKSVIDIFDALKISVDIDLMEPTVGRLDMGIALRNDKGDAIFNIGTGQSLANLGPANIGKYRFNFDVTNVLNEGIYHLTLRLNENRGATAKMKLEDIISFEIIGDVESDTYRRIPGIIRPTFKSERISI